MSPCAHRCTSRPIQKAFAAAILWLFVSLALLGGPAAQAHNLDQQDTRVTLDAETIALMASRAALGQPLLQAGDTVGVILKSTPGPGTVTGAGGYLTFYIPPGTQVVSAEYGALDASGVFVAKPMKGPAIMPIGDGPIGSATTAGLIGLTIGPNVVGVSAPTVSAAGVHNGTIAGVYADTGIFYSTDPKTVLQSFVASGGYDGNTGTSDNVMVNNFGKSLIPTTLWDADQLIAFGLSSPALPIIDPNGRGSAPWGMASPVAGPESGYISAFNRAYYLANPADPNRLKNSIGVGPWRRLQYPGSQAGKDQPGLKSTVLGYVGVDVASIGYALSPATPLPPTLSSTDTTSPKAIRFSYGLIELGRPEFARVKFKILANTGDPGSPFTSSGSFTITTDAFGGDAGGELGGKDHVWRYYLPNTSSTDTGAAVQKTFSKTLVSPGDTLSFQLQVINGANRPLTNVTVRDILPAGLTYLSATPAPTTVSPLTYFYPSIPANSVLPPITVYVKATVSGTIVNTVTLTSDQATASYKDSVEVGFRSLLNTDKTVTPSTAPPGSTVTYTMTVKNDGTASNGTPLVITENLPSGFTYGTLVSSQLNGAATAPGVVSVNSTNPAKPVFTVSQAIQAGKTLVLTFTAVISATEPAGVYGNAVALSYEGKTISSGSLAPVTVGGGRIGDTVFRDWNGNGVQDPQDEGLPGVTVQLFASNGTTLLATRTTDANGQYLFTGLAAGTYVVKTSGVPAGYVQTFDADGLGTPNQSTVTIVANEQNLTQDFGYRPGGTGSIGDRVFRDVDNNGVLNGTDTGIKNITVDLYEDTNGNGAIDAATDALVATTQTDNSGVYGFSGLATGISYLVKVNEADPDFATEFNPNPFIATTPNPAAVPNLAGSYLAADFGYFANVPASIGDQAFIDLNGNGTYEAGVDAPVTNVTVNLYRDANGNGVADAGELVGTTVTDATGAYRFSGLGPLAYIVAIDTTDPDIPADTVAMATSYTQALAAGQNALTADFPFRRLLNKTVDLSVAAPGNTLNFTITPFAPGPDLLTNAIVTDNVPTGTTFVSAGQGGLFDNTVLPGVITWNLGTNSPPVTGTSPATGTALLPGPLFTATPDRDTYIREDSVNSNFGGVTPIISNPKSGGHRHLLVHFDTSSIPANAIIQSATLKMRSATSRTNHTVSVRNLLTDFTELGATWSKRDGTNNWAAGAFSASDYSSTAYGSMKANNKLNTVDVTDLVKAWQTAGSNKGIALIATGTDTGNANWNSREAGTQKPTLEVRYLIVSNSPGSGTNVVAPNVQDGWIQEDKATFNYGASTTAFTSSAATKRRFMLMKFTFAGVVPPGATINSATLQVNVRTQRANHVDEVHRMVTAWTEGTGTGSATLDGASFQKRDGVNNWAAGNFSSSDYAAAVAGTFTPSTTGIKTLDVTSLVNDWINNGVTNNGIVLVATGSDTGNAEYYTKEDTTAGRAPVLTVTWTQPLNFQPGTTTTLNTSSRIVAGANQVTLTMTAVATDNVNNVTPPTNLTVNISGTATASKVSGPTPSGPVNLSAGVPQTFTWVYNVTPGVEPSDVDFSGAPTSANAPFVTATSESIISTPPLTFQATVNTPPGVTVINNTAELSDDGALDAFSPTTTTNLGAGIGDRVFSDLDGNGTQGASEPGLAGLTVRLFASDGTTQLAVTTTDAIGAYLFTGLSPGTFVVKYDYATAPTGYLPTTPASVTVTGLASGQQYLLADFGLRPPPTVVNASTIGDTVWLDANGNGTVDSGETLLAGVAVRLYADTNNNNLIDAADVLLMTQTTNASGAYLFGGLNPGNYLVSVDAATLPAGVALVSGGANLANGLYDVTLGTVQNLLTVDFGYNYNARIGDTLFYDPNLNGVQNAGEGGAPGATVVLYGDMNANGAIDPGEPVLGVTATNASGAYLFDHLPPGNYVVKAEEQSVVAPPSSANAGLYGFMQGTTGTTRAVALAAGQSYLLADFGFAEVAVVEGHVFYDANGNGVFDAAETALPNVTVTLTGTDSNGNTISRTLVTDAEGEYEFVAPAGTYTIAYATADPDIPAALSTLTTPSSVDVVLTAGAEVEDLDFGRDNAGKIGDLVYSDANGNGVRDAGEPGLAGVVVALYADAAHTILVDSQVTDALGAYLFSGLPDGTYFVQVQGGTVPAGFNAIPTGDPDATKDGQGTATLVTGTGTTVLTMDFGYQPTAVVRSVSGVIFKDLNNNGVPNVPSEQLTAVTVTAAVDTNNDNVADITFTTSTNANGAYSFSGIPNGANIVLTVGALPSPALVQTVDPDATLNGSTQINNIAANVTGVNFGYVEQFGTISGTVVRGNGNGVADAGEPPIGGVTITLLYAGSDGVLGTADDSTDVRTTNASGGYVFTNLLPGAYQITETNLANYVSLADADGGNPDVISTTLAVGQNKVSQDFEDAATAVSGHLYIDTNGNGVQDGGEPNLPNVDVVITTSAGGTLTVSTDASGNWSALVPPGTTTANVSETDPQFPAGATQTDGTDPTTVTAVAGTTVSAGNDGYFIPATVTGHLYIDTNGNGTQDAEEPNLANVDVVITKSTGAAVTVSTNASGNWTVSVPPGNTTANVDETDPQFIAALPAGYVQTQGNDPTTVTAVAGASTNGGIDGYFVPATVTGHLYLDSNGNGTQDAGEPNLAAVDVVITTSSGGTIRVTTNASGNWTASVPPGSTTANVDETDPQFPAGSTQTQGTDPTTVTAVANASTNAGINGYFIPATVTGHLYLDTNGNGVQDAGEPNLANVDVVITTSTGGTLTVSTDANGNWTASVPPGSTTANVNEADPQFPAGSTQTQGTDPTTVNAVAGASTSAGTDGYFIPATVAGHLYVDTNGNGTQDAGEPNLAAVDVVITTSTGATQRVTTDASGNWTASVPPGSTSANVDETDLQFPAGSTQTQGTDPTTVTAVAGASTNGGIDGYFIPATVTGHLYLDTNGNGTQDAGEPNLPNVDVVITKSTGATQRVTTDANGNWTVSVPPGSTTTDVDETDPQFPAGSTHTQGTDPTTVTAAAGASTNGGIDGYFIPATVIGHLYIDTNGNGTQDAGEPNLANVDVVITTATGGTLTVSTDASGNWTASVPPGSTTANVNEADPQFVAALPAGYVQTQGNDPTTVTAVAGASTNGGIDGYFVPATVTGHLYLDTNGNGTQDAGEPNLFGVDVVITTSTGATLRVTTDASGNWTASVPPGTTTANVDETDPQFPSGSTQTQGIDPTTVTAVANASTSAGVDGYFIPATVTGHLYIDTNGNGTQDAGEPNLANVDVVITTATGGTLTVSTDASGNWTASVPPGSTTANVNEADPQFVAAVPAGYVQTQGNDPTTVTAVAGVSTNGGIDGYFIPATVTGHLYIDTNGNGVQDAGEPNLANVDVVVTKFDGTTMRVTTDASGNWTASVPPGSTTANVDEADPQFPAGSIQTQGNDPTTVTAVANGSTNAGIDGYFVPATVTGHLYIDTNGNGTQDAGEPNLANIDVVVTTSTGATLRVSTNASGNWTATVPPGSTTANVDEADPQFPAGSVQSEGNDPTTVTAVAGASTSAGIDGYFIPATVTGHLYLDTNGNGTQDAGEPNLPAVDVVITKSDGTTVRVTTDASGNWTASVPPGSTTANVDETDPQFPAGSTQTQGIDPTTVTAVANATTSAGLDGYFVPAIVTGHLYVDLNGDGAQQPGEPNLAGVDVVITTATGGTVRVSTNASGNWTANVPPGSTTANVDETDPQFGSALPPGYVQTEGTDPTTVTAVAGTTTSAGNDGYFNPGTFVTGHLYVDTNGNGTQDPGEPNLAGVDVRITKSDSTIITVVTDASGVWTANVSPGLTTADVQENDPQFVAALPPGFVQTEGTDPTTVTAVVNTTVSAGNDGYHNPSGTVTGHLYVDTNGNGTQDAGEPNLANVDVIITTSQSGTVTASTDASGNWSASVPPGSTSAMVDVTDPQFIAAVPAGYVQTEGTDPTVVTVVQDATTSAGNDGYFVPATVTGHLYLDTNGNGTQDAGEPNLASVDLIITKSTGATARVTTDASGNWTASVPPGSTTADVDETDPQFPAGSTHTQGTDPTTVTAVAGASTSAGIDGYFVPATVTGHLYLDTNGNGVQDAGEPNLASVDVVITTSAGSTMRVSTDASGNWTASVPPGSTTADVDETDSQFPAGSTHTQGTDPTTMTAVAGANTNGGIDGYFLPATVTGHLYADSNGNGVQDAGEPNLANVDVVITASTGATQRVSTDASGNWTASVPPGSTTANVDETDPQFVAALPAGYVQTDGSDPTTVTAVAGASTSAGADGYFVPATVTGHLYVDTNGNGTQDAGEPNLPGVDVVVTKSDGTTVTVTTDVSGNWTASVPPGSTTANVNEADPQFPAGSTQTQGTDPTTVTAVANASTSAGNDGYFIPAVVTGHLYVDTNGNGTQDAGEPNLANVDVVITTSTGATQRVSTDASGNWTASVPPGSTTANVDETDPQFIAAVPAGSVQTDGSDPTTVTAVAGASTSAGVDGYFVPATVTGHLYIDTNGNGTQDAGEPNLAGVDVIVTKSTGGAVRVTTDASGNWTASVPPGSTTADVDETDAQFPAGSTHTEGTDPTTVTAVANATTSAGIDGYFIPATVTGHLYIDTNGNGVQDAVEPNLANVDVVITTSTGGSFTVSTNASGDWSAIVPPGSTTVNVSEIDPQFPAGSIQTQGTDPTTVTAVAGGSTSTGIDGYFLPATVTGHLYIDTNGNGTQDGGEPNLPGVDVVVTKSDGTTVTVSTDASGNWTVSVPPGSTTANVNEADPQFPAGSTQTEGTDPTTVTAVAGTSTSGGTDGYFIPATVTGHLYLDVNANGRQDPGEPDFGGVDVVITTSSGGSVRVSTDLSGNWVASVPPGNTTADVDETDPQFVAALPPGYGQTEGNDPTTVNAVANASTSAGNDGYSVPASALHRISGTVYKDGPSNNNLFDASDTPIANVTMQIYRDVNGDGVAQPGELVAIAVTQTNVSGAYSFGTLPDGHYLVVETNPAGAVSDTDADGPLNGKDLVAVQLAGADVAGIDFLDDDLTLSTISGDVTTGTDPIPGVIITLLNAAGEVVGTTATSLDGSYSFANLPNGSYTVVETNPAGVTGGSDVDGGDPDRIAVAVNGSDITGRNFVDLLPPAARHVISGSVFDDGPANNNVIDPADTPIANVTVSLYRDLNLDGLAQPDELIGATLTDVAGAYRFAGLADGSYLVVETNPAGALSDADSDGPANGNDLVAVALAGADQPGVDFLDDGLSLHTISGKVTDGTNPISAVIITLRNAAGDVVDMVATAVDGSYQFANLPDGTYTVTETNLAGTTGGSDADGGDPDVIAVTVAGGDVPGRDFMDVFGAAARHAIRGGVFLDGAANNNVFDPADGPIANVTINLYRDANGDGLAQAAELLATTITQADGTYAFTGLLDGPYLVVETNPAGAISDTDADGPANGLDLIAVTLAGVDAAGANFLDDGISVHAISGQVTDGSVPIPGVIITLQNGSGDVLGQTTTGPDGSYRFANLPDGNYVIVETNPPGTLGGSDVDGGNPDVINVVVAGADVTNQAFIDLQSLDSTRIVYTYCKTQIYVNMISQLPTAGGAQWVIVSVTKPAHGTVAIKRDGYVLYSPTVNFLGNLSDVFMVTLTDGKGTIVKSRVVVKTIATISGTFQGLLATAPAPLTRSTAPAGAQTAAAGLEYGGRITITKTQDATFSARLELPGEIFSFRGALTGALQCQKTFKLASGAQVLVTLVYHDRFDAWSATVSGAVSLREAAPVGRVASSSKGLSPAYTAAFVPAEPIADLSTAGFSTVRVLPNGAVILAGKLAGDQVIGITSRSMPNGDAAIFLASKLKASRPFSLIGLLNFNSFHQAGTLTGALQWHYQTLDQDNQVVPESAQLEVVGSRYTAPAPGAAIFGSAAAPTFTLRDDQNGAFATPAPYSPNTRIIVGQQGSTTLTLSIQNATGLIQGSLQDSTTNARHALSGVVLQSESQAWGISVSSTTPAQSWSVAP